MSTVGIVVGVGPPYGSRLLLDAMHAISSFQDLTNDFGPFVLELGGQGVDVDAGLGEPGQHLLAVAAVARAGCAPISP